MDGPKEGSFPYYGFVDHLLGCMKDLVALLHVGWLVIEYEVEVRFVNFVMFKRDL